MPRGLSPGDSLGDTFLSKHFNFLASQGALQGRTFLPAQMYPKPDISEQTQQHLPCLLAPVSQAFGINARWMLYAKGYVLISANKSTQFSPQCCRTYPLVAITALITLSLKQLIRRLFVTANLTTSTMHLSLHNPPQILSPPRKGMVTTAN